MVSKLSGITHNYSCCSTLTHIFVYIKYNVSTVKCILLIHWYTVHTVVKVKERSAGIMCATFCNVSDFTDVKITIVCDHLWNTTPVRNEAHIKKFLKFTLVLELLSLCIICGSQWMHGLTNICSSGCVLLCGGVTAENTM